MLEALLIPESIAVIGASRSPGKVGHEILTNLVASGFVGWGSARNDMLSGPENVREED